jgi:phosphatidylethanolamine/phosphatidyl-N-methylethanolamine N-methyltransferase
MPAVTRGSENFYDRLKFLYPVIDLFLRGQKRKFFTSINSYPHGRLLEIGVGNGAHLNYYNKHDIVAIDTSQGMLAHAHRHVRDNVQLIRMDGEALLFPDEGFDYVVMSHVIAVVQNPERLFNEVHRVLKPGGKVFILNHFTPNNWLKYVDRVFNRFSRLFHFRSAFLLSSLHGLKNFRLVVETNEGIFSYFKILIYEKKL